MCSWTDSSLKKIGQVSLTAPVGMADAKARAVDYRVTRHLELLLS